jgi:hypothetical protein
MNLFQDYRKIEVARKSLELSVFLLNKIITDVQVIKTWKETEIEKIILTFSDRTMIDIYPSTERGCLECDSDGSLCDYLNFFTSKLQ